MANITTPVTDIPIPLQDALRDSITSGTFIDTKFWVFSKRNSKAGRVGEPKALFVNGHVVRSVPRLSALLDQKETKENLRIKFPADRKPYTCDYEYDADSDLEEDEDSDFLGFDEPQAVPDKVKNDKSGSGIEDMQNSDGMENTSDIISISDMDSLFSHSPETKAEAEMVATPPPTPTHTGTVVVIEDFAFVTFQALLRYLYTNEIEFAPWGSKERRKARTLEEISEPYKNPKPSPKSMYRLADKYDIPELKELALQQIQRELSKCDIMEEVFSEYTSRYPELRKLELKQLARALLSNSSSARRALKDKIQAYSYGELPHAKDIFPALHELMESDEAFKEAPTQPPAPFSQGTAGGDWEMLKGALTSSITSGAFLDSQFYALDSKSGSSAPRIRPVYFCSSAGGAFLPKLLKYSSRIGPSTKTLLQYAGEYDSDVDCEASDTGIPVDAYPRSTCIPEDPSPTNESPAPLVLKSGTAKTWNAIFFYVYTSQIIFSTIGSPGTATKSQEWETTDGLSSIGAGPPREPEIAVVGPCSPKSVYALANKIGLTTLRDLAFDNIESQLCEENIVKELFSPFAANHKDIIRMQHKLFYSKFKSSVGRSSFLDIIRDSPSGENPHHMIPMGLIFDRTIDDCQERMLAQARKLSQADPVVQPDGRGEATSTLTTVARPAQPQPLPPTTQPAQPQPLPPTTQPAQPQPLPPATQPPTMQPVPQATRSKPTAVQQVQTQPLRTEPDLPKIQPSKAQNVLSVYLPAQPSSKPPEQRPTSYFFPYGLPQAPPVSKTIISGTREYDDRRLSGSDRREDRRATELNSREVHSDRHRDERKRDKKDGHTSRYPDGYK